MNFMKRLILYTILCFFSFVNLQAQEWKSEYEGAKFNIGKAVPTCCKIGNVNYHTSSDNFRGYTVKWGSDWAIFGLEYQGASDRYDVVINNEQSNDNIRLQIAGQEKMFIQGSTGNIGVGTVDPTAKLHVVNSSVSISPDNNLNHASILIGNIDDRFGVMAFDGNEITQSGHNLVLTAARKNAYNEGGDILFRTQTPALIRMTIKENGDVGIGTTTPNSKLNIYGGRATIQRSDAGGDAVLELSTALETDTKSGSNTNYIFTNAKDGALVLRTDISTQDVQIQNNATSGNVLIGDLSDPNFTYTTKEKLMVNGNIAAKGIKIHPSSPWPDYVFDKDYSLQPLSEVESYISENKKLPAIPSAQEIKEKGMDMPELQRLQMQKIEELTLYAIAQQKQIEELIKRNKAQEQKNKLQEQRIKALEKR